MFLPDQAQNFCALPMCAGCCEALQSRPFFFILRAPRLIKLLEGERQKVGAEKILKRHLRERRIS
jgi:hypothetical protein